MSTVNPIEIDTLTRRFGDVVAVNDLSLTVEEGEIFGFLGPNGAGKSTTINILLGFLNPSSGSATILGHDVTTESRTIRERIGLLPEGYDVYENLTGREHIVSAIETKQAADDLDAIIERVGLDPNDARRAAGEYSKGMIQRMALGIALVGDPDLLILDEPSSGLDPPGVKRLRRIVGEEVERGATVFFSSHVLDEVERVCDRVGIMQNGTLVAVNSVEDQRSELEVESVVEVTVDHPPDDLPMEDIDGVIEVTVDGTVVRVRCARPAAKMRALRRIDDIATVTDIAIEDGSLETIFEAYTGRTDARAVGSEVPATGADEVTEPPPVETGGE
jgi:ABC-2 type transport system ATP-binding protein